MQKTTWQKLDPAERTELEAALTSTATFLSDEQEAQAFWLLLGLASAGGIIACVYDRATDSYGGGLRSLIPSANGLANPTLYIRQPQLLGFYVALVVAVWVIYTVATQHKRRGVAITSYGLARIRGRHIQLFRYRDIVASSERTLGARGKRFTVLTLTEKDGKQHELYCHGSWAEAARGKINAAIRPAPSGKP